jgi:hypothetical protein
VERRFIPEHLSGTWGCNFRVWAGQLSPPLEARHLAWCGSYLRAEDVGAGAPAAVAGVMHGLEPAVAMARRAEGVRIGLNTLLALWPMAEEVRLWAGVAEAAGVEPGDDEEALGEAVRRLADADTAARALASRQWSAGGGGGGGGAGGGAGGARGGGGAGRRRGVVTLSRVYNAVIGAAAGREGMTLPGGAAGNAELLAGWAGRLRAAVGARDPPLDLEFDLAWGGEEAGYLQAEDLGPDGQELGNDVQLRDHVHRHGARATGVRLGQNTVIGWSPDRDAILAWGNAFYGNPEGGGAGGGAVSGRAPRAVAAVMAAAPAAAAPAAAGAEGQRGLSQALARRAAVALVFDF